MALCLFGFGVAWSWGELQDVEYELNVFYFGILLTFFLPLGVWLSAKRFQAIGSLYSADFQTNEALKIVALGKLANLFPVPGGVVVRWEALRRRIGARLSAFANSAATIFWVTGDVLVFGAFWAYFRFTGPELYFLSITLLLVVMGTSLFLVWTGVRFWQILSLLGTQTALSAVNVVGFWYLFLSVGAVTEPLLASGMSLSNTLGVVSGVAPGGIGVSEVLASGASKLLNERPELGFAIVALHRCLNWLVMAAMVGVILLLEKGISGNETH